MRLSDIPLRRKLIGGFLLVGSIPVVLLAMVSLWIAISSLRNQTEDQLTAVREMKKYQLQDYFEKRNHDLDTLGKTVESFRRESSDKLSALRDSKQAYLRYYLNNIKNQVLTFSENRMVVDAMAKLPRYFELFRSINSISAPERQRMTAELRTYWDNEFSETYRALNNGQDPQVETYFDQLDYDSLVLQYYYIRANENPLGSKDELDTPNDRSAYSRLHASIHPPIRSYLRKFGYYDIFLVDSDSGDIVYSVFKELDYSTSLIDGPFADTNFGRVFRRANEATEPGAFFIEDFEPYWPSYEAPAAFVASPIFDNGKKLGVAIFQFPIDTLNEVMTDRSGLGDTGETYLVGSDYRMRSDSFLDPENRSLVNSFRNPEQGSVQTEAVESALRGESRVGVLKNYQGEYVLSAWSPFRFETLNWAILSEKNVSEVLNPKDASGSEYYADFSNTYGYYDLFLINPDGEIFYTVAREADYQTNILNGPYADSNLGDAVREALANRDVSFADFQPYAPSNDAPAAFVAKPVLDPEGEIQVVVALQLSDTDLNAVMQQRAGMGETGETYLVGDDFRMRSSTRDSNRNLAASFQGTVEENGVQSSTVRAAIAGQSETSTQANYANDTVLSSFAPLSVFGKTWALVAEIKLSETLQPIWFLLIVVVLLLLATILAVLRLSFVLSNSITTPLKRTGDALQTIATQQDLTVQLDIYQRDEVGQMAEAMRQMVMNLSAALEHVNRSSAQVQSESESLAVASTELAEKASSQAAALEQVSATVNGMSEQTQQNRQNATQATQVTEAMRRQAREGGAHMQRFSSTMDEIQASTQDITQITDVINEIAAQTRMLAINASIEAARAGVHGSGFAVVAQEVQKLAAQTAESVGQITELIGVSVQKVQGGRAVMEEARQSLEKIVSSSEETAEMMKSIQRAADEQSEGIRQINIALDDLNNATMENSQLSESNANSSEALSAQSEELQRTVANFRLPSSAPQIAQESPRQLPHNPSEAG